MNYPSTISQESTLILTQLTQAYGFDLGNPQQDIYLHLELENYCPLVLERHEPNVFSLSHYYVQNGDLMADPDVTFLLHPCCRRAGFLIFPLTYQLDSLGLYLEHATLNRDRNQINNFKPNAMADLANSCDQWCANLKAQQWFLPPNLPNPLALLKPSDF